MAVSLESQRQQEGFMESLTTTMMLYLTVCWKCHAAGKDLFRCPSSTTTLTVASHSCDTFSLKMLGKLCGVETVVLQVVYYVK